ncbi:MAG: hypothetical protein KDC45_08905 [Bacteroidetes bacterium]|nr:hypothetical protein [Bacteroidota bacterium]
MIMIDSDVFILDNFYPHDPRYEKNNLFLHRVQTKKNCTTIFNVLEVCSLIAPHCSDEELLEFFEHFDRTYNLEIVYPQTYDLSTEYFMDHFFGEVLRNSQATGNVSDSLVFTLVKQRGLNVVVSWQAKQYKQRLGRLGRIEFLQPDEYIKIYQSLDRKTSES